MAYKVKAKWYISGNNAARAYDKVRWERHSTVKYLKWYYLEGPGKKMIDKAQKKVLEKFVFNWDNKMKVLKDGTVFLKVVKKSDTYDHKKKRYPIMSQIEAVFKIPNFGYSPIYNG